MKKVLYIVDVQNDFISNSGSLPVPDAESIIPNIVKLILNNKWDLIVASKDTHFENTYKYSEDASFGFPPHCILSTNGWELNEEVKMAISKSETPFKILYKMHFDVVKNNEENLKFIREELKDTEIHVVGVATNYCVFYAVNALYKVAKKIVIHKDCIKEIPDDTYIPHLNLMKEKENVEFK